jgi:hypothetical protein
MDRIVTTAIVGTGQAGNQGITTNTPVDTLTTQLSGEPERQLLLTAGAWSLYRRAGRVPSSAPSAPPPAEPESLAVCSPRVAQLMDTLLHGQYHEQLQEALERVNSAHLRLPYNLLIMALGYGSQMKEARATLVPALGVRGRWLSQFNSAWSWVTQYLTEATQTLPGDAEIIWQEGTHGQRCEILRRLRQIDPARAREWLTTIWKQEKAETRNDFLATFEANLSLEDELLLEQALDDRSSNVRSTAASLLARLPLSALAQRMQSRADSMLAYTENELAITPPQEINEGWIRDGIAVTSTHDKGERATWMTQVLAKVPPQHWEVPFGASPQQLIEAATRTDWSWEIITSWSHATLLHHNANWIALLLNWWHNSPSTSQQTAAKTIEASTIGTRLLSLLPQKEAEQKVLQLRENGKEWMPDLATLPRPWSKEFGDNCLQIMRDYLFSLTKDSRYDYEWANFLQMMIMALPPSCFASALQPWELPDIKSGIVPYWQKELSAFEIRIDIRKRVLEEIK